MEHGRDHDERLQKNGSRIDQQLERNADDEIGPEEFTRQARSSNPAPTEKGVLEERERHARTGTTGGNVDHSRG